MTKLEDCGSYIFVTVKRIVENCTYFVAKGTRSERPFGVLFHNGSMHLPSFASYNPNVQDLIV
jgi:hypothetical protein